MLKAKAGKDEVYDALKPIFESIKKYAEGTVAHKKDRGPEVWQYAESRSRLVQVVSK